MKKYLVFVIVVIAVSAFWFLGVDRYLTLEGIKAVQAQLASWRSGSPFLAGPNQFTHTAAHQSWYAAVNAVLGEFRKFRVDYSVTPWTTFIDPEVARVGPSEQEAAWRNIAVEVSRFRIDDLDRAIADSAAHGFIKVLTVPDKDRILGVTIVGEHAGESSRRICAGYETWSWSGQNSGDNPYLTNPC